MNSYNGARNLSGIKGLTNLIKLLVESIRYRAQADANSGDSQRVLPFFHDQNTYNF